jgi:hypothetical protein
MGGHLLIYCTFVDERGVNIWMKPASPCLAPSPPPASPLGREAGLQTLKGGRKSAVADFRLQPVQRQFPEACQRVPSIATPRISARAPLNASKTWFRPAAFRRAPLPRVDRSGIKSREAPVAQLDRALPSEGKGQRFESPRARHFDFGHDSTFCRSQLPHEDARGI